MNNKIGELKYWKGKKLSEEHKRKLSESHKGYIFPKEQREKISKALKGGNSGSFRRGNHPRTEFKVGIFNELAPNWKGGKTFTHKGYILRKFKNHPRNPNSRYIFEHRLVMEEYLGRNLEKWERIHHKNGIKNDNRIENLEIVVNAVHYGLVRCPHCLKNFLIR